MARHLLRKSVHSGLASLLTAAPFSTHSQRRLHKKASRPRFTRLFLEPLEDRTLLSASISGTILSSATGLGLVGQIVYLNKTPSGTFNTTVTDSAPTIDTKTLGAFLTSVGGESSALPVQGVPSVISDVAVAIDLSLSNSALAPVTVALFSPTGLGVPALPTLFNIDPGEHFVGTFDDNTAAAFSIQGTQAPGNVEPGSIQPQQLFDNANSEIFNGNPNGTWGLAFFADNPGDDQYLTLNKWSLTFTAPNISTVTDAQGNYSFTGLQPGSYTVSAADSLADVITAAPQNPTFNLANGQNAAGVNFSVQPAPDLTGVAFNVVSSTSNSVTIKYTLTNQGNGNADPFNVDLLLSANGNINANDPVLDTIPFSNGLAAHSSTSGTVTVALPANTPASDYVGFLIHSPSGQTESNTANNSNQGAGVDLALVGANTNQQLTTDSGVQQEPSIAVDPNNPNHIVVAYMDYSLLNTGYAGIGLQSSIDGGATWTTSSIPLPAGFDQGASNPIVHFDNNGNVYIAFSAVTFLGTLPGLTDPTASQRLDGFTSDNGIFVASGSFDAQGNLNLGTPTAVVENMYTGTPVLFDIDPDFAVNTTPGSNGYGNLYVTWTRFYPAGQFPGDPNSTDGSDVMIAVSTNGGASWTTELQYQGGVEVSVIRDPNSGTLDQGNPGRGFAGFEQVSVGPQGDVYVSAYAGGVFTVYHSFDAGQTFTPPDYGNDLGLPFGSGLTQPNSSLFTDAFRTLPIRDIVADPSHPGRVYAVDATTVTDANPQIRGEIDAGTIVFAVSNDYGLTWHNMFTVGANATNFADLSPADQNTFFPVLNDDNGGDYLGDAPGQQLNNAVIAGQALPSLGVDANGNLTVIWYDARTDSSTYNGNPGTLLSVFGTVSTDGGNTFSPNFAVATQSFNPYNGVFVDGSGRLDGFLGDYIGVAAANGVAYAVWTATDGVDGSFDGQQHIYFDKYQLTPAPQPPADRFSPNNTMATATDLGPVSAQEIYSRLNLPPGGSDEWFTLQAGATGELSATVSAPNGGSYLRIEVTDANGHVISTGSTPLSDSSGNVIGQEIDIASLSGTTYFVHVFTPGATETAVSYTLIVETLTADLGTQVEGSKSDSVSQGGTDLYRLVTGVAGTLDITVTGNSDVAGTLNLAILGSDGQTVLASDTAGVGPNGTETLAIQVTAGQLVFLQVSGANLTSASGDFTLDYTNFDQFEASGIQTLFVPTVGDPTSIVAANLDGGTTSDLLFDNTNATDTLGVLKSNGDGTFQAPQDDDIGPGQAGSLTAGNREIAVADLTNNGAQDVIVPNFRAADVSVLLDNGSGGFQPQRTFDAVTNPDSLVTGDFGNGETDAAVLENFNPGEYAQLAILLGRGDGTFGVPTFLTTIFKNGANSMVTGDFTGNGNLDIIVFSKNEAQAEMFLGNGDGTFNPNGLVFNIGENTFNAAGVDLNGAKDIHGNPIFDALVTTSTNSGNVYVQLTNGKGGFDAPTAFQAMAQTSGNVSVYGLAVTSFAVPAGNTPPAGMTYGPNNIVVTAQLRNGQGAAEVLLLPELLDSNGNYAGYGAPIVLADVGTAGNIAVGHFVSSSETDLAVADKGGVTIIYGQPLTLTPGATRNLGNAEHVVTQPQAIVTGYEDAPYTYTVPTEAAVGSGAQVVDISALLQYVGGPGLQVDVFDATTHTDLGTQQFLPGQMGTGVRSQVIAAQGDVLQIHVSGLSGTGFGAYTLDVDVLPQVVSVQAESAVPGAPAASFVLALQGDRLDPTAAENPNNYIVTWLGPDGIPGSSDNQVIPAADYSVAYNPDANVAVAGEGVSYAAAVQQTITLTFASALPAGSYEITVKANLPVAAFSTTETALVLPDADTLGGHQLVSSKSGMVNKGSIFVAPNLVGAGGTPDPTAISNGSAFLTQLQNDLSQALNSGLQDGMSDAAITATINQEIYARFAAAFAAEGGALTFAVIWLDPVSLGVQAPQGTSAMYSLASNMATNNISQSYVSVGGNVEVVVLAGLAGTFKLDVGNVPQEARGGVVVLDSLGNQVVGFTQALRSGTTDFAINIPELVVGVGQGVGNTPGQVTSSFSTGSAGSSLGTGAASVVGSAVQTTSAILISAILAGVPNPPSTQTTTLGGDVGTAGAANSTLNSSTVSTSVSASSSGGGGDDSDGAKTDGRSALVESAIDKLFLNFPDSVSGFIDLAGGLVQDGEDVAQTLTARINAFLKSHKPPAPMGMPPESLQPAPDSGQGGKAATKQGESKAVSSFGPVAGVGPVEESQWRANEYGLTLFLASGLCYVGLRDMAGDESDFREKRR